MVFILLSEYQQLLDEEDGRGLDSSAVRKAGIYAVAVDLDGVEKVQQERDSQKNAQWQSDARRELWQCWIVGERVTHQPHTHL